MSTMTVAVVCSALLAALIFLLGFNVSRLRGVTAKEGGDQMPRDATSPLLLAVRAHGNTAEYAPSMMAMFLLAAWLTPGWWVVLLIVGATISRYGHVVMMLISPSLHTTSPLRMTTAMGTYVFGLALAVTVGVAAVV